MRANSYCLHHFRGDCGGSVKKPKKPPKKEESDLSNIWAQAIGEMPLWAAFFRLGGSLTPERVSSVLSLADTGRISQLVDLIREYREKDGHLHSILQTREQSLSALNWAILADPLAAKDLKERRRRTKANKRAALCELALRQAKGLKEAFEHLNGDSLLFGFATVEVVWRMATPEDGTALKGLIIPDRFIVVATRRFGFGITDSSLLYDPLSAAGGQSDVGTTGIDLCASSPPGKYIQVKRRVTGDVLAREGLARVLIWPACFRNWDLRDWLTSAEMSWKPWIIATFLKGADKDARALAELAMQKLSTTGRMVKPEFVDVDVAYPKNATGSGGSQHKELYDELAGEMSKTVLGQKLSTEAGNRGARSLGETQVETSLKPLIRSDADLRDSVFTSQYVRAFYMMNWGAYEGAAMVSQTQDRADLREFSASVKDLAGVGHPIQSSWIRDQIGQPEPTEGEEMLGESNAEETDDSGENTGSKDPEVQNNPKTSGGKKRRGKPSKKDG